MREPDAEDGARVAVFYADRAAVRFHRQAAEREPEAAIAPGSEPLLGGALNERLEHALALVRRDAAALIGNTQQRGPLARARADADRRAGGSVANRIVHEVLERTAQQIGVGVYSWHLD